MTMTIESFCPECGIMYGEGFTSGCHDCKLRSYSVRKDIGIKDHEWRLPSARCPECGVQLRYGIQIDDCDTCKEQVEKNMRPLNLSWYTEDIKENKLFPEKTVEGCMTLEAPKVKDYALLIFEFPSDLKNEVKKRAEDGWELQGGICVDNDMLYQAMVKYE